MSVQVIKPVLLGSIVLFFLSTVLVASPLFVELEPEAWSPESYYALSRIEYVVEHKMQFFKKSDELESDLKFYSSDLIQQETGIVMAGILFQFHDRPENDFRSYSVKVGATYQFLNPKVEDESNAVRYWLNSSRKRSPSSYCSIRLEGRNVSTGKVDFSVRFVLGILGSDQRTLYKPTQNCLKDPIVQGVPQLISQTLVAMKEFGLKTL